MKQETEHPFEEAAFRLKMKEGYYADQPISPNLFILSKASGTKETGRNYPQVQKVIGGNFWDDGRPGSVHNLEFGVIPDDDFIDFGTLQLYRSSKVSDTISAVNPCADGFYLSEFALQVFLQFNLGEYKVFPVTILHKEKDYPYFWLHLKTDFNPFIDFSKSEFYQETGMINGSKEMIKVKSIQELMAIADTLREEWINKKREYTSVDYKIITLKESIPDVDIFGFSRLGIDLYITERFKDAIINAKLTGFEIREQSRVHLAT